MPNLAYEKDYRPACTGKGQSSRVYDYILDKIKGCEWQAGDKIHTEMALCEKLNVSRIAVRTALDKLSALGILERRKGSGTFLVEIDLHNIIQNIVPLMMLKPMDIIDVLYFRLYFEPGNVREFMKKCNKENLVELRRAFEEMKSNVGDCQAFYLADYKFHTIIARGTQNQIVISINDMLRGIMVASFGHMYSKLGPLDGISYHEEILLAIEADDRELAELHMVRHIEANIQGIVAFREEVGSA